LDSTHQAFVGSVVTRCRSKVETGPLLVEERRFDRVDEAVLADLLDSPILCACGEQVWGPRQAINFVPAEGMMLQCDFSTGFRPPEIVKMRPVVVVSKRARNRETCIVVPISKTAAADPDAPVVPLLHSKYGFLLNDSWAKCQCPNAVSWSRLYLLRGPDGRRIDSRRTVIDAMDLQSIREGVAKALGAP
jgi:uncharacterized protein YifN (PemK superfamily)